MAKGPPKGTTNNPFGRAKGTPNKATTLAREAIARFVDCNVERLSAWLDEIAADDPKDAFNCFMSVVEYHVPKLARTEHTGQDGEPIKVESISQSDAAILERWEKLKSEKEKK